MVPYVWSAARGRRTSERSKTSVVAHWSRDAIKCGRFNDRAISAWLTPRRSASTCEHPLRLWELKRDDAAPGRQAAGAVAAERSKRPYLEDTGHGLYTATVSRVR